MRFLQRLMTRLRSWRAWRRLGPGPSLVVPPSGPIFREVTPSGVRVYSLCGGCGARLEYSATLCGACAKRRSPSPPS